MPTSEVLHIFDSIEAVRQLAERFWVECPGSPGIAHELGHHPGMCIEGCQGNGKLWPLRTPCRCVTRPHSGYPPSQHQLCQGRGWLPNVTMETVWAAILAKGWIIQSEARPEMVGDSVIIRDPNDGCPIIGRTWAKDGPRNKADNLRDLDALVTAALRALEGESV